MKIIGLTGRTGSGKSFIADILAEHGAYIIDADKIAHGVLLPGGGAYDEVVGNLGECILDENRLIGRKKVAEIVFKNPAALRTHTETTHKYILKKIYEEIENAKKSNYQITCIDAPLLVESGLHKNCDVVWAVHADDSIRLKRITGRDNISEDEAKKRMQSQTPFDEIKKHADVIFINDNGTDELTTEVIDRMNECLKN